MRTTHVLQRVTGDALPSMVACLDTQMSHAPQSESDTGLSLIAGVTAVQLLRFDRGGEVNRGVVCADGSTILDCLHTWCRSGVSLWVIGRDMYRQLVALRFFDRIDGRQWELRQPDPGPDEGTNGRPHSKRNGFAVLEPGCTILVVTRPDGGTLHVVDVQNYGVGDKLGYGDDPRYNAALVGDWVVRWRKWLADHCAGSWRYTLGSQAMYAYRRSYIAGPIVVHDHAEALSLEGDALYGGRCEVFRRGVVDGPIYHLDIRSLYGAVAQTAHVPVALQGYSDHLPEADVGSMSAVIADVTVRTDTPSVPYRDHVRGITIWPTGTFRTTLCGPELQLVSDRVTAVHRVAWYLAAPIFGQWAVDAWRNRQQAIVDGNQVLAGQMKLWSQVLYGKFGQRYRGWRHEPDEPCTSPWALWWAWDNAEQRAVAWRSVAGRVERHIDAGWTDHACPAIAAWITSLARVRLWEMMVAAGREEVYYCDTDSLFLSSLGDQNLTRAGYRVGDGLGELQSLGIYGECDFRGVKHYYANGRHVCAGLSIDRPYAGDVEPITQACRRGRPPIPLGVAPKKPWDGEYQHGRVRPCGEVEPWDL